MFESVREFNARMKKLLALACPASSDVQLFNDLIRIASDLGLNYREGLEYVIRMRSGGAD